MNVVVCVNYTEYERDWGPRPDGHSFHKDMETAKAYIKDFINSPAYGTLEEYTSPGEPFLVEVSKEIYDKVQQENNVWGHVRQHYGK